MIEFTATETVAAPPDRVWELLCDTSRYAEWVAGTDAVTRTDGPARPGSTYDERNPIAGPWKAKTRWTVADFDPPRSQRHTGEGVPLMKRFEVVMAVAPAGEGSEVTVTLRAEPGAGPLGGLFARLMSGGVERDNRKTVQSFAELVKAEAQSPVS